MSSHTSKDAKRRAVTANNKSKHARPRTATGESESSSSQFASVASPSGTDSTHKNHHQNFVLADPVAFSYIEEDPSTSVVERSHKLQGYQCYVVEQWACSRSAPTIIIAAYTGDPSHSINVGIISVPSDEEAWSLRLRIYFKALAESNTKRKDTPLGALMVTNLSGFPSSLTIIPIPDGNVRKHREDFFVNENLKRLGCAGRTGISLAPPSAPTQAKFHQVYKTSEKVGLYESVMELVRLCQIALVIFGVLESEYADGLLCDVTERASREWWAKFGLELYGVEPIDGVLGPTTVAALLGTLIGARNRLHAYGTPVQKDVFDMESTKHAAASFQKSQRLRNVRKRRLDQKTLNRLHEVTSKQAAHESWAVPRAVKSTVAEFSGKGGEMVMDMVRGKDRASIAEMESTDIDRFTQLVGGERAKWLWLGKPLKRTAKQALTENPIDTMAHGKGHEDTEYRGPLMPVNDAEKAISKEKSKHYRFRRMAATDPVEADEDDAQDGKEKRTVFGRATGRLKGKAKSQLLEHSNRSKDLAQTSPPYETNDQSALTSDSEPMSPVITRTSNHDSLNSTSQTDPIPADHRLKPPNSSHHQTSSPMESRSAFLPSPSYSDEEDTSPGYQSYLDQQTSKDVLHQHDIANYLARETEMSDGEFLEDTRPAQKIGLFLRSTRSFAKFEADTSETRHEKFWPRHLSFSAAEGAVLRWSPVDDFTALLDDDQQDPKAELVDARPMDLTRDLAREMLLAEEARRLRGAIARIGADVGTWLVSEIAAVEDLDEIASEDLKQLTALCEPVSRRKDELARDAGAVFAEERGQLEETARNVGTLGAKLDYELGALRSKVEDVDDAVAEFEKNVRYTEDRVGELVAESEKEGWWGWAVRMVLGLGSRPSGAVVREEKGKGG